MSTAHRYAGPRAAYAVKTAYGTFHLCHECHEAGHGGDDTGANFRPLDAGAVRFCDCEHASHFEPEQVAPLEGGRGRS